MPSLPLLACWVASGPIVATVHTAMRKSRVLLATQPVLRSALEKIDGRIAVSEAARSTFVEHLGRRRGADPERGRHPPLPARPTRSTAGRGTGGAIGFLGRMDEPRKGLAVLLRGVRAARGRPPGAAAADRRPGRRRRAAAHAPAPGCATGPSSSARCRRRTRSACCTQSTSSARRTPAASRSASSPPRRWRPACRSSPSDIPAFRDVLRGGQAGELFVTGDADDLARVTGAAARRPGPPRRAVGRRPRRGGRLRLGHGRAERAERLRDGRPRPHHGRDRPVTPDRPMMRDPSTPYKRDERLPHLRRGRAPQVITARSGVDR